MIPAPTPPDEEDRLTALRNLDVLDTQREPEFDALVHAASCVAGVPISLISLVDQDRQWFKANVGLEGVTETDRESAFCSHAILQDAPCLVPDATRDERFQHNPLVTGAPGIRFYCGIPLKLTTGQRIGTLCVIDQVPRQIDEEKLAVLGHLANAATAALEGRKAAIDLARRTAELEVSEEKLVLANRILEQANEDLDSFVRIASHDLRSPLITIERLAGWIMDDLGNESQETILGHASLINSRAGRMDRLLTDLRQFTKLGRTESPVEVVRTDELVRGAFEIYSGEGNAQLELDGDFPVLETHAAPLEVVFRNLIGNAIKFGSESGVLVRVSARTTDGGAAFAVSDNGPGIAPEFHEAVFDHFTALQSKDTVEGSGLGLTFVKRAVEVGGGKVELESDGRSGATFRFTWPAKVIKQADPAAISPDDAVAASNLVRSRP